MENTDQRREKKLVVSDACYSTTVGEETFLLQIDDGVYFGVNELGTAIWQMLESEFTVDQIINSLRERYGELNATQLEKDVTQFLEQLTKRGLVVVPNPEK